MLLRNTSWIDVLFHRFAFFDFVYFDESFVNFPTKLLCSEKVIDKLYKACYIVRQKFA